MSEQENQTTQAQVSPVAQQLPLFELDLTQPEVMRVIPPTDTRNQPAADRPFSK